jgi:hypothetical protein
MTATTTEPVKLNWSHSNGVYTASDKTATRCERDTGKTGWTATVNGHLEGPLFSTLTAAKAWCELQWSKVNAAGLVPGQQWEAFALAMGGKDRAAAEAVLATMTDDNDKAAACRWLGDE